MTLSLLYTLIALVTYLLTNMCEEYTMCSDLLRFSVLLLVLHLYSAQCSKCILSTVTHDRFISMLDDRFISMLDDSCMTDLICWL